MAAALDDLEADPVNARAWRLYHQCVNRLSVEGGAVGFLLSRLARDLDEDEFADLVDRCVFAFDVFNPVPESTD